MQDMSTVIKAHPEPITPPSTMRTMLRMIKEEDITNNNRKES